MSHTGHSECTTPSQQNLPKERTWEQVINDAENRGRFFPIERLDAASWYRCACCNLPKKLRNKDGSPIDTELNCLGSEFYTKVKSDNYIGARSVLKRINNRIEELVS